MTLTPEQQAQAREVGKAIVAAFDTDQNGYVTTREILNALEPSETLFFDRLTGQKISYLRACSHINDPELWPRMLEEFAKAQRRENVMTHDPKAYIDDLRRNGFYGQKLSEEEIQRLEIVVDVVNQHIHTWDNPPALETVCKKFGVEKSR